jgi:hypothetical protein
VLINSRLGTPRPAKTLWGCVPVLLVAVILHAPTGFQGKFMQQTGHNIGHNDQINENRGISNEIDSLHVAGPGYRICCACERRRARTTDTQSK